MEFLLAGLSRHGLSILLAAVFLEACGIPVPAALALVFAGGASARGAMSAPWALSGALAAMLLGDTLLFLIGRYTGWWMLGLLCRLSMNPESCILSSADSFYRRGRTVLIFAKFVPGINTMAPPLAGSMNMRFLQFLRLDMLGASLYVGAYFALGFVFSGAIEAITNAFRTFGRVVNWAVLAAVAGYIGYQFWTWRRARAQRPVPSASPAEAAEALASEKAVIYDVRSHGYYDRKATRIRGSLRLDPNALPVATAPGLDEKPMYVYCTCIRNATSARVARTLLERGVNCTVIDGGLRAWKKAGLPLEAVPAEEMAVLPGFN